MTRNISLHITLLALVAFAAFFVGCDFDKHDFLNASRGTFEGVCKGDYSVEINIDWKNVKINGEDIGQAYRTMSTDYEQSSYKKARLANLGSIFAARKWTPSNVRNWRIETRGVESATVVADAPNGGKISMDMRKFGADKKILTIQIR